MQIHSNSQKETTMPWWHSEKKDRLSDRIVAIQKVNDPTTYADEVLTGSKILLALLLIFSGMLGSLSYFRNFSISFPFEASIAMAVILTIAIEWGKNKAATWAVRIPFFQGWRSLGHSPSNTFIFIGLVAVALATFTMSIYNSTKGGEQLAKMLSHERNQSAFQPDTKSIDEQMGATQQSVANAPMITWKGKQYYQDAKAVRSANKTVESLARQRESIISAQRADYERNVAIQADQTNFASKLVLASGGWIELLQILLIILRVACERNLDGRIAPTPLATFKSNQSGAHLQNGRPIGFNVADDGNVRSSITQKLSMAQNQQSVPQSEQSVPQPPQHSVKVLGSNQILLQMREKIQRDLPNMVKKNGVLGTIHARIVSALDECFTSIKQPDFLPSRTTAIKVYQYLSDQVFPELNRMGYPYERDIYLIKRLSEVIEGIPQEA